MKSLIVHRFLFLLLCITLALSLIACDRHDGSPASQGGSGATRALSGQKGTETGREEEKNTPEKDPQQEQQEREALMRLYEAMAYNDQYAGAVVYLGFREQEDSTPLSDWLRENCPELTEEAPFLLNMPEERILGAGWGEVYCIVPRNEQTTLTVSHVDWVPSKYEVEPVMDTLYQEKGGQPVLIFVNLVHDVSPDIHILFENDDSLSCGWFPLVDNTGIPQVPEDEVGAPFLLDFGIWGYIPGLDGPEGPEPPASVRWAPPTAWQLAYTSWMCEHWDMEFSWGDSHPDYAGTMNLYYQAEDGQEYKLAYSGVWRMENGCLRMELSDEEGNSIAGNFPARIDPFGEYLYIELDWESGVRPPFLGEDQYSIDLTQIYG